MKEKHQKVGDGGKAIEAAEERFKKYLEEVHEWFENTTKTGNELMAKISKLHWAEYTETKAMHADMCLKLKAEHDAAVQAREAAIAALKAWEAKKAALEAQAAAGGGDSASSLAEGADGGGDSGVGADGGGSAAGADGGPSSYLARHMINSADGSPSGADGAGDDDSSLMQMDQSHQSRSAGDQSHHPFSNSVEVHVEGVSTDSSPSQYTSSEYLSPEEGTRKTSTRKLPSVEWRLPSFLWFPKWKLPTVEWPSVLEE